MLGFSEAIRRCLDRYAGFTGRAQRSEYWWWVLFIFLGNFACGLADAVVFGTGIEDAAIFGPIFGLATLLPSFAVTARRLHDTGRSGWWQAAPYGLVIVTAVMGGIGAMILFGAAALATLVLSGTILYWLIRRGDAGPNRFGPDPLGGSAGLPDPVRYHRSRIPRAGRDD